MIPLFATIRYLAEGYFHQDYDLDAHKPIDLVEEFASSEPSELVEKMRHELEAALVGLSEEDLVVLWLEKGHASYDPRRDELTLREWFNMILDRVIRNRFSDEMP